MRFSLSSPLPLLLIWCSLVCLPSDAVPPDAYNPQEPWSTVKLRPNRSAVGPLALESETQTPEISNESEESTTVELTVEQLKDKLEKAENKTAEAKQKVDDTREALEKKKAEVIKAKGDYDEKKKKFDALDEAQKTSAALIAVQQRVSNAISQVSDAEGELKRVADAKARIDQAKKEQQTQSDAYPGLESAVTSAETIKNDTLIKDVKALKELIKGLENKVKTEPDLKDKLDREKQKLAAFETAKSNWETATKDFEECKSTLANLTSEIAQLDIDSQKDETGLKQKVDAANDEKTKADEDLKLKQDADKKAQQAIAGETSDYDEVKSDLDLAEVVMNVRISKQGELETQLENEEKELITVSAQSAALKQQYDEKKKAAEPQTGSMLVPVLVPLLIIVILAIVGVVLFLFFKKRRSAAAKAKNGDQKPSDDAAPASATNVQIESKSNTSNTQKEPNQPPAPTQTETPAATPSTPQTPAVVE